VALIARVWILAVLAVTFVVVPLVASPYWLVVLTLVGIAAVGATGLNVLVGYAGQISLGHAAFAAVGAYTSGLLVSRADAPFWVAIPTAMVAAGVFSLIFGLASLRVKGLYLAIATLAAQYIVQWILSSWTWITGGFQGIVIFEPIQVGPLDTTTPTGKYLLVFIALALVVMFVENLMRSRSGRAMIAVRDQDIAAAGSAVSPLRYKLLAFFISSAIAGLSGVLYGYNAGLVSTEVFTLALSVQYLAMILVGGLGSIPGSILGAAFITMLPIWLRDLLPAVGIELSASVEVHLLTMLFGVAILLFLVLEPRGLYGLFRNVKDYFRMWPFSY
jgi:branched-chain amino acid transport system permease protein